MNEKPPAWRPLQATKIHKMGGWEKKKIASYKAEKRGSRGRG